MPANVFEKHPLTAASGVGPSSSGEGATDVGAIVGALGSGAATGSGGGAGGAGSAGLVLGIAGLITNLIVEESNPPPKTLSQKERGLYEHLKKLGYDVAFTPEGHLTRPPRGQTWGRPHVGDLFWQQGEQPYEAGTAVPAAESIAGPYTPASGALAGALLRRKRIKPSHLAIGGTESVLQSLVGSLFSGGGF